MIVSTILAKISYQDLLDLSSPPLALITDVKYLSSYNWSRYLYLPLQLLLSAD